MRDEEAPPAQAADSGGELGGEEVLSPTDPAGPGGDDLPLAVEHVCRWTLMRRQTQARKPPYEFSWTCRCTAVRHTIINHDESGKVVAWAFIVRPDGNIEKLGGSAPTP